MPRPSEPELFDPRSTFDPAWGGVRSSHAEDDEFGVAPDAADPESVEDFDRYGEDAWTQLSRDAPEEHGDRVHGRRWRSRPKRAGDVMTTRPHSASPDATLKELAQVMVDEDCGIVPIVERGRLVGVVTDRDIVCRTVARRLSQRSARARDVMSEDDLACVEAGASLDAVLSEMERHRVRRICVVDEADRLLGIISMSDLAREADVDLELQDAFLDISSDRSFWSRLR
jgi:CBS domain-containing protein